MATVQRDITFKQSSGVDRAGRFVTFAQDEILLNGVRVGYVGHGANEGACLIRPMDDGTKQAISDAITAHRGTAPKTMQAAPAIPDTDLDSGDDDE